MKRPHEDSSDSESTIKCSICAKSFKTRESLKQHLHIHKAKLICKQCGQSFSFVSNLKRHEKNVHGLHVKSKKQPVYKCDVCNKVFGRNYHLVRHRATVHQLVTPRISRRTFTCRHCDNIYENYQLLIEHIVQKHPLNQHGGRQNTKAKSLDDHTGDKIQYKNTSKPVDNTMENIQRDEAALRNNVQNRIIYPRQGERYDVLTMFANVREEITRFLRSRTQQLGGIKWNLCVQVEMQRDDGNETVTTSPCFRSRTYHLLNVDDMDEHDLNEALQKMFASLEKYMREGSGWFIKQVVKLEIHTVVYRPLYGSSFIPLPKTIALSHSVLNIKNDDEKCFLYCVLASLHPANADPNYVGHYEPYKDELDMSDIRYPVTLVDIGNFEKQNENISVNVFTYDDRSIVPLRVTSHSHRIHHVNLLLLTNAESTHYCLIKDLNRFLSRSKKNKNKVHFCSYCLHGFKRKDLLEQHQPYCSIHGPQKVELPSSERDAILTFKEYEKSLPVSFVIYADLETVNVKLQTCSPNPEHSASTPTTKLEVCGYGYKVVCEDEKYTKPCVVYRGPNASRKLIQSLLEEREQIVEILSKIEPMKLRAEHNGLIENATHCCLCKKEFTGFDRINGKIVRHHNHLTGEIIGTACQVCNINCKQATFTCVFFHNLKNFDAHILCESLGEFKEHRLTCIAQNSERYVSFQLGGLRFLDSFQFLPSSLEVLVENLKQDGLDAFHHMMSEFEHPEDTELVTRKGVYPYDYMDSFERFNEQELPPLEAFYSSLKKENISKNDYEHAQLVFERFNIATMGEYHDLYLKVDVLLLSDVFESFRKVCLSQYELDPCHFYTSPGLSWSSLLKMTGVKLELITDIDQMLMVESGIRGGLSQISNRYKKANNPYLDDYDQSQPTTYLQYLDANNLYGWAMTQPLPVGSFQFVDDLEGFDVMSVPETGEIGYILEVSLHYPQSLHTLHNCLPLAVEQKFICNDQLSPYAQQILRKLYDLKDEDPLPSRGRVGKLLATLSDKDHYVLHYRNLQLYVRLGMEIKAIHRAIQFHQETWMKPYIEYNTERRKRATSTFQKNFYKLMNVSVFGKTMENVRKHKSIELIHREERLRKVTAKPTYKNTVIFNDDLVAAELTRSKVKLFKPSYSGMCILDLSKHLMYDFWYNHIKKRYGTHVALQMTDTDSLLYYCETEDIYDDMQSTMELFDTSDYPKDHHLQSDHNKKALGKMKDETNGIPISEFCGLRSKMYSFVCNQKEEKRAKGIAKVTVKKELKHEHYKEALFGEKSKVSSMTTIRSHKHELFCETIQKTGLSPFDDKRYLVNSTDSYAYGHFEIGNNQEQYNVNGDVQTFQLVEDKFYLTLEQQTLDTLDEQSFVIDNFKVTPCVRK